MRSITAASAAPESGYVALKMRAIRRRGGSTASRLGAAVSSTILVAAAILGPATVAAATQPGNSAFPDLPVGFAKVQLASGLKNPTAIAFAPSGDIYIAQQRGAIRLYRGGALLTTPEVLTQIVMAIASNTVIVILLILTSNIFQFIIQF